MIISQSLEYENNSFFSIAIDFQTVPEFCTGDGHAQNEKRKRAPVIEKSNSNIHTIMYIVYSNIHVIHTVL